MIEYLLGDELEQRGGYIDEVIYRANDGIVTTFAGVAGAALDPAIVLILGVANLLADGFSMGMSNYLSRRSELDYQAAQGRRDENNRPPAYTALVTFLAFIVAGWAPLVPYAIGVNSTFQFSVLVTGVAFFTVGASRTLVTNRTPDTVRPRAWSRSSSSRAADRSRSLVAEPMGFADQYVLAFDRRTNALSGYGVERLGVSVVDAALVGAVEDGVSELVFAERFRTYRCRQHIVIVTVERDDLAYSRFANGNVPVLSSTT